MPCIGRFCGCKVGKVKPVLTRKPSRQGTVEAIQSVRGLLREIPPAVGDGLLCTSPTLDTSPSYKLLE